VIRVHVEQYFSLSGKFKVNSQFKVLLGDLQYL